MCSIGLDFGGGVFVDKTLDSSGKVLSASPVTSIYASDGEYQTVQTTHESYVDSYYADSTFSGAVLKTQTDSYNVMGSPKKYIQGETLESIETSNEDLDLITGEESVFTTYSESEPKITWNSFVLDDSVVEPTLDNYKEGYIAPTVRSNNRYGTVFYVHKLNAIRTGTRTVTKTVTATKVLSGHTTAKAQKVTEKTYVKQSDDSQENVTLQITRTTETTSYGEYSVQTTVTTTTYTETIKQAGYIFRGYYSDGKLRYWGDASAKDIEEELVEIVLSGNQTPDSVSNPTLETTPPKYEVETFKPYADSKVEVLSKSDETVTTAEPTVSEESFIKTEQNEYIERVLQRQYNYSDIILTEVSMPETDADGNAVLENGVQKKKYYTSSSPLALFQSQNGVPVQKYYLSQCYSKTYPFFVNTIFEQIL